MNKVLIASDSLEAKEILFQIIKGLGYNQITCTQSGSEARRYVDSGEYELIVINTPLSDEFGREFAVKSAETTNSGIILLCRSDIYEELSDKLSCCGIFVVQKPVDKTSFTHTVKLASATRTRMLGISDNTRLQSKTEEIKLINRAKSCLMQYLKFTEPQAHRYIEKQAMDTRQTRREVAKRILSTYEN